MKNLYEAAAVQEVMDRLGRLGPDSQRLWGKMTAAQMAAHCSAGLENAVGDTNPSRMLLGRIVGPFVKKGLLGEDPVGKNSPTAPGLVITDDRNLEKEKKRLSVLIQRFSSGGPAKCTTHPNTFLGPLTPAEWARLMYKHLDHHFKQFGV